MAEIEDWMLVHTVTVEPQIGEGSEGDLYGPAESVACFLDDERRLVRGATGAEVVSETTLICRLGNASKFLPDSRVTLPDGRVSTVILTKRRDDGGVFGTPQHLEVSL